VEGGDRTAAGSNEFASGCDLFPEGVKGLKFARGNDRHTNLLVEGAGARQPSSGSGSRLCQGGARSRLGQGAPVLAGVKQSALDAVCGSALLSGLRGDEGEERAVCVGVWSSVAGPGSD
jgi:hypothetical protein